MNRKLTYWPLGYGILWLDSEHAGVNEDNTGGGVETEAANEVQSSFKLIFVLILCKFEKYSFLNIF